MIRAFKSEWIKLTRRNHLIGFAGALIGFSILATTLVFLTIDSDFGDDPGGGGPGGGGAAVTVGILSQADGAVLAVSQTSTFIATIVLALFASSLAREFTTGAIRMLFVTAPGRVRLLAGKLAALSTFAALLVAAAVGISVVEGLLLAPGQGIDTSAWTTAEGIGAIFATYGNMTGAVITAGLLGAILAIISRSPAIAISIGTAYILIVEPLVGSFWDALGNWGPSAMISALVAQGTDNITYLTAVIVVALYGIAAVALSSIVLARRDVTS